jgi:hypothetical protein
MTFDKDDRDILPVAGDQLRVATDVPFLDFQTETRLKLAEQSNGVIA